MKNLTVSFHIISELVAEKFYMLAHLKKLQPQFTTYRLHLCTNIYIYGSMEVFQIYQTAVLKKLEKSHITEN